MERIPIVRHVIGGKIRLLIIALSSYRTNPNAAWAKPDAAAHWLFSRDTRKLFRSSPSSIPSGDRIDCLRPLPILERPTGAMSMNIFRLCGDMSHVFSIIVLLLRLRVAKNASGEWRGRIRRFVLCLRFMCLCVCPCRRLSKDWPTAPHGGDEICIFRWRRGIDVGIVLPCGGREAMPQLTS